MPRYFFDIEGATGIERDEQGLDLPGLDAAKAEAIKTLSGMTADHVKGGGIGPFFYAIQIRDGDEAYQVRVSVELG